MRELINHTVTIDYVHNYKIDEIKEGGMSYVLLLSKVNNQNENPLTKALYKNRVLQDRYSLLYRDYLAAKIVKETTLLPDFERECSIWLGFSEKGIVPLLKVANIKESILALMPRYTCSLRKIILDNLHKPSEILRLLYVSVESLHNIYKKSGIIHQDIKPENFLIMQEGKDISIFLSDWGIANIQAKLIPQDVKELSEIAISTMGGIGTMPYMAPERFKSYISNVRADIFSLGMIFFEIVTGVLPYKQNSSIAHQIISGEYFHFAEEMFLRFPSKLTSMILSMIHPFENQRLSDYKKILKFLKSL